MQNFQFYVDTNVYFGKGQIINLPLEILKYGKRVLFVYGGASIKRNGLYDTVLNLLCDKQIEIVEFGNVEPNPTVATVEKGISLCRNQDIDVILCVGGGSVIDCGKAISAGIFYEGSPWNLVEQSELIKKALPVMTVLTMAASGSEMDEYAVLTNERTMEKRSMHSLCIRPRVSILDPEYTYTLPPFQTAAGVADIMSHLLDCYFKVVPGAYLQQRVIEALLTTCIAYGPIAVSEPENYEARANIMWASSWAVNGMVSKGFSGQSPVHPIEHPLSARYGVTHGAGLAVLTPYWMKYILDNKKDSLSIFTSYAQNVWKISGFDDEWKLACEAIRKTSAFFHQMGLPSNLRELGIHTREYFLEMAGLAVKAGASKTFFSLSEKDVEQIYENAYKGELI